VDVQELRDCSHRVAVFADSQDAARIAVISGLYPREERGQGRAQGEALGARNLDECRDDADPLAHGVKDVAHKQARTHGLERCGQLAKSSVNELPVLPLRC
jgi:hypothetical protein